jgi:moderate conductance mechanosensitive channel
MVTQNFSQAAVSWILAHGLKVALILLAAYLVNSFLRVFIKKGINKRIVNNINGEKRKRAETLISVFGGTLSFIIWIAAVLMILPEFGINVAPILAGLGLAGLAVGMAAKDILADFIAGLFILLEGQYYVGDTVKISGLEGEVREITLRRTIIRDEAGIFHSFPNSQIKLFSKKEK